MTGGQTLVADIGGTNARFAIAGVAGDQRKINSIRNFRSEDFETIGEAAKAYLAEVGADVTTACFAVAAPAGTGDIIFTNSPWRFNPGELKAALGLERLKVVNDFYALAAGVLHLDEDAFHVIRSGSGRPGTPRLVIGPGTGFGQALVLSLNNASHIIATEGGHVAFAPGNPLETEILERLSSVHRRVSVERLLSGPGLLNVYLALCEIAGAVPSLSTPEEITIAALNGSDDRATRTVNVFCSVLGAVAGDAVLASGAQDGVYLGGGILMRIKEFFLKSEFVTRFEDKGRMQSYVQAAPVRMITVDNVALLGAAFAVGNG